MEPIIVPRAWFVKSECVVLSESGDMDTLSVRFLGLDHTYSGQIGAWNIRLVPPVVEKDLYAVGFRRARLDAARRLCRDELLHIGPAAAVIGLSKSQLEQIEAGKRRPSFETLLAMAAAYNVLPGDLLPTTAPKGSEVDRVLGSLMVLPPTPRVLLMQQFEGMARALAASIADVQARAEAERVISDTTVATTGAYTREKPTTDVQRQSPQLKPTEPEEGTREPNPPIRSTYRITEGRQ